MSSKRILPYNSPGAERLRAASTSKRPKSTQSMASNGTQHQAIDSFIFEMEAKHPEAEEISIQGHVDEELQAEVNEQVFASFLQDGDRVAIAYYSTTTRCLSATSLFCSVFDLAWVIRVFKQQVAEPAVIITNSSVSEVARRELALKVTGETETPESTPIKILKAAIFVKEAALRLLSTVRSLSKPEARYTHPRTGATTHGGVVEDDIDAVGVGGATGSIEGRIMGGMEATGTHSGHGGSSGSGGGGRMDAASAAAFDRIKLSSMLDTEDGLMVRAAGGLLQFMVQSNLLPHVEDGDHDGGEGDAHCVVLPGGLRQFNLSDFMHLDATTFAALNIKASLAHPCLVQAGGKSKEGFSLVALLDRTCSPVGKRMLQAWCLRPLVDVGQIRQRHDAVAFLMAGRSQLPEVWGEMRVTLKKFRDTMRLMVRIKEVKAGVSDWFGLQQSILAATILKDGLLAMASHVREDTVTGLRAPTATSRPPTRNRPVPDLLQHIIQDTSVELSFLQSTLDGIIDWNATREESRICVKDGLDVTLDEYRRVYYSLPSILTQVSAEELLKYATLTSLSVKYLPQIGCVLSVDKADNGIAPSTADARAFHAGSMGAGGGGGGPQLQPISGSARAASVIPPDFDLQYETGETIFFKNGKMHELDKTLGDMVAIIHDLEASILRQLEEKVLEFEALILLVGVRMAEMDVLMSFAEVSQDYNYVRPKMVEDSVLYVKGARHPLQECSVETFIPNDIAMAPGREGVGAVMVVTGPNFSGKSVYLKTVGLIPYMAQIGCFVSAAKAVVGVVDRIFTRVHSLETATLNQSTFTIDLNQISLMLRHATPRSMLLIDEFGKGTSSVDGVALLAATIRALLRLRMRTSPPGTNPRTVITTHFREVFDLGLLEEPDASPPPINALSPAVSTTNSLRVAASGSGSGGPIDLTDLAYYQMQVLLESRRSTSNTTGALFSTSNNTGAAFSTSPEPGDDADPDGTDYADAVVSLFKLLPGRAASSYGLACAVRAGMPKEVCDRAAQVSRLLRKNRVVSPAVGYVESAARLAREHRNMALLKLVLATRRQGTGTGVGVGVGSGQDPLRHGSEWSGSNGGSMDDAAGGVFSTDDDELMELMSAVLGSSVAM